MKKKYMFIMMYFLLYLAEGLDYCFLITFLNSLGYSAAEKSVILALGACVSAIMQFAVGYLCDRNSKVKRYVYITNIIYGITTILVYAFGSYSPLVHTIIVPLNIGFFRLTMGVLDNWVIESDKETAESYGTIRAFGSLGWACGSAVSGFIVKTMGYFWMGLSSAIIIALGLFIGKGVRDADKVKNEKLRYGDIVKILSNPMYDLIVACMFIVFIVQSSLDMTVVDKYAYLNATENEVSLYWSLTGVLELPLFFLGDRLAMRFRPLALFMFATVVYGIRLFGYGSATTVNAMLWPSILQMLSFPIINLIAKDLVLAETPGNLKSSGLQIGLALYSSLSALCSPLIAGALEQRYNINIALFAIGSLSILALALTIIYMLIKKRQSSERG